MGENFTNIVFNKHRLNEKGIHGIYELDDKNYISVCSGGDSYGDLYRVEYHVFLAQLHGKWFKNIKSTFEVALVIEREEESIIDDYDVMSGLTQQDVEDFIKKVKQKLVFKLK